MRRQIQRQNPQASTVQACLRVISCIVPCLICSPFPRSLCKFTSPSWQSGAMPGALPAAAHLKMPNDSPEALEQDRKLVKTPSPEAPARTRSPAIVLSDPPHGPGSGGPSSAEGAKHSGAKRRASVTTARKMSGSKGYLGSRLGAVSSSSHDIGRSRPLTEAAPTWRNTPSWESTGWYSRGSLLDSATDAQVAPVRKKLQC